MDYLDEVMALTERGLAVCEVAAPLPDGTCSCRMRDACPSPGKHPVGRHWQRRATIKPRHVAMRLRLVPHTSYGLIPQAGSGMIVIDRDDPDVLLPMPETYEVHRASADPRKGHFFFALADDVDEDEVPRAFSGGEVRVAGSGHVVGPGCRHASGDTYESNHADVSIADRELVDALRALRPVRVGADGHAAPLVGTRHAWLVGQARKMAGWGWDADRIEESLRELNEEFCVPPLDEKTMEPGRMAQWAVREIPRDQAVRVRRVRRRDRADRPEWAR